MDFKEHVVLKAILVVVVPKVIQDVEVLQVLASLALKAYVALKETQDILDIQGHLGALVLQVRDRIYSRNSYLFYPVTVNLLNHVGSYLLFSGGDAACCDQGSPGQKGGPGSPGLALKYLFHLLAIPFSIRMTHL